MTVPTKGSILIVDDEPEVLAGLEIVLGGAGYGIGRAASGSEALEILRTESYDLVLTDLQMPGMHGPELVETLVASWPDTPVVVLTAYGTLSQAVETMRLGAADYLVKPIDAAELLIRITRRLEDRAVREERRVLRRMISETGYQGIIGRDPKMTEIYDVIERVADAPSPVLIEGEPGTGKELIAQAIHSRRLELRQERSDKPLAEDQYPFIGVNCGAFARQLLESQLFGHKKGSFTGASADQDGVFHAARSGTLLLDEITELDIDLQVKLLRALQEREVTPLGDSRAIPVHARIITATNRPVLELVRNGEFRADLYYRIHVVGIVVPPLRERRGDIPLLCERFILTTAEDYDVEPMDLAPEVLDTFLDYPWPGNVRELQNAIERAFALGRHKKRIELKDIPLEIRGGGSGTRGPGLLPGAAAFLTYDQMLAAHIREALRRVRGVKSRAATLLDVDRNRLARWMEKFGIE